MSVVQSIVASFNVLLGQAAGWLWPLLWLLVTVLIILIIRTIRAPELPGIPCPPRNWLLGHALDLSKQYDRMHDWVTEWSKKYPTAWYLSLPLTSPIIWIFTPENIEYMMKTNFDNFEKGQQFRDVFHELLGDGIFNVDGDSWRSKRKVASHMFSQKALREDMFPVFVDHGYTLLKKLQPIVGVNGQSVDLQDLFFRFTMDCICEIAFGQNIDTLAKESTFAKAFDQSQYIATKRFFAPPVIFKLMRFLNVGSEAQYKGYIKEIRGFCDGIITARTKMDQAALNRKPDLLSRYITSAREVGQEMTLEELRDVVLNFMIAGRDTTACLLSWSVLQLCRHPAMEKRILSEIQELRAKSGGAVSGPWTPTYDEIYQLPYLDAFLREVLRLYPSVPSTGKFAVNADVLPDGKLHVPAGATVCFYPWAMARMPQVWGPDAEQLKPERWLGETRWTAFEYPHFNAGPRICLGQHVAIMEAKVVLAMLLTAVRIQTTDATTGDYVVTVTMPMKSGLHVTLAARNALGV